MNDKIWTVTLAALTLALFFHTDVSGQAAKCDAAGCADTTVYLNNGIHYITKRCQMKESCLQVQTVTTPDELARACCLNTISANGTQMITAGMVTFKSCRQGRFRHPFVFRIPVPYDEECGRDRDYKKMKIWTMDIKRRWAKGRPVKIVAVDGREYYEFTLDYPVSINLDYLLEPQGRPLIVKFKAKQGITVQKLSLVQSFPMTRYDARIKRSGNVCVVKIYGAKRQCRQDLILTALGRDLNGNIVAIDPQPVNAVANRWYFGWKKDPRLVTLNDGKLKKKYILVAENFVVKRKKEPVVRLVQQAPSDEKGAACSSVVVIRTSMPLLRTGMNAESIGKR